MLLGSAARCFLYLVITNCKGPMDWQNYKTEITTMTMTVIHTGASTGDDDDDNDDEDNDGGDSHWY